MKILVGVKHVPDTETKIRPAADGVSIDESGVKWVPSTYDEFAIEEALKLKDAAGAGEVVLVHAGRESGQASLRTGLAMGADRAILIVADGLDAADGMVRARLLAAVARAEEADLLLCGKYGVGTDEGQTGPMAAELLGWAHSGAVSKLELADGRYKAHREVEGAIEVHEGALPAVLTCDKGLNEPRYASLKGIMQAKKKPIDRKTPDDFGVDLPAEPAVVVEALELPPARQAGRTIEGTPQEAAAELVRLLREEAKVI